MDPDVAVLKQRADDQDRRMARVEDKLDGLKDTLIDIKVALARLPSELDAKFAALPTKRDLEGWKVQWLAIGVAMFAIIVGGIIGGLEWIKLH